MSLEDIEIEELKQFAEDANNDGWDVKFEIGILKLSDHKIHPDIEVYWEKGNETWRVTKEGQKNVIPVNELSYPNSIYF